MTIVASIIASADRQADGRFQVHEVHTDNLGLTVDVFYLATPEFDRQAALSARAIQIAADQITAEVNANVGSVLSLGSLAVTSLSYSTLAQNLAALRAAYLTATQEQAIMAGDFLSSLTGGQLQTIFGLTAGQVTTLRTNKLTPAANLAASIRLAAGA